MKKTYIHTSIKVLPLACKMELCYVGSVHGNLPLQFTEDDGPTI